eukprot:1057995-Prorocentrum_minimum.AAC.1
MFIIIPSQANAYKAAGNVIRTLDYKVVSGKAMAKAGPTKVYTQACSHERDWIYWYTPWCTIYMVYYMGCCVHPCCYWHRRTQPQEGLSDRHQERLSLKRKPNRTSGIWATEIRLRMTAAAAALLGVAGIGAGIAKLIDEYLAEGTMARLEELRTAHA